MSALGSTNTYKRALVFDILSTLSRQIARFLKTVVEKYLLN